MLKLIFLYIRSNIKIRYIGTKTIEIAVKSNTESNATGNFKDEIPWP